VILVCLSSKFLLLYVTLMLNRLDIATELTLGDASCMTAIESFTSLVTHGKGGETLMENNRDSLDAVAGTHTESKLQSIVPYSHLHLFRICA